MGLPRKGTETYLQYILFEDHINFNLSPQGDGNDLADSDLKPNIIFQLIPARGRKPISEGLLLCRGLYYPRKGTKTRCNSRSCTRYQYHPRKGAKTEELIDIMNSFSYHPRKGAKT